MGIEINIYIIQKQEKDEFNLIVEHFKKIFKQFGKLQIYPVFNKDIAKAHKQEILAKKSYTAAFDKYLGDFNIALDVKGKQVDSFKFAQILQDKQKINFFIGGAYGFEEKFLKKCDLILSLSDLTFSHKIAKIVLCEQIFRGFSIINNHPYHKN